MGLNPMGVTNYLLPSGKKKVLKVMGLNPIGVTNYLRQGRAESPTSA